MIWQQDEVNTNTNKVKRFIVPKKLSKLMTTKHLQVKKKFAVNEMTVNTCVRWKNEACTIYDILHYKCIEKLKNRAVQ